MTRSVSGTRIRLKEGRGDPGFFSVLALANVDGFQYFSDLVEQYRGAHGQADPERYTVVMARDPRQGSGPLVEYLAEGMQAASRRLGVKLEILYLGIAPKPIYMNTIRWKKAHGGVNVTASHNPTPYAGHEDLPEFIGWEFSQGWEAGGALLPHPDAARLIRQTDELVLDLKKVGEVFDSMAGVKALAESALAARSKEVRWEAFKRYRDFIREILATLLAEQDFPSLNKVRVVFDSNGSSAGPQEDREPTVEGWYPAVWADFGLRLVHQINRQTAHDPNPDGEGLDDLVQEVKALKADFGTSVDIDADRIGMVLLDDATGEAIRLNAQQTASLVVWLALEKALDRGFKRMDLVLNEAASLRFEQMAGLLEKRHPGVQIRMHRVGTGEANVVAQMHSLEQEALEKKEATFIIGTEPSHSGVILPGSHCYDACLSTLLIAHAIANERDLLALLATLPGETSSDPSLRWRTSSIESQEAKVILSPELRDAQGIAAIQSRLLSQFLGKGGWPSLDWFTGDLHQVEVLFTVGGQQWRAATLENALKILGKIAPNGESGITFFFAHPASSRPDHLFNIRLSGTTPGLLRFPLDVQDPTDDGSRFSGLQRSAKAEVMAAIQLALAERQKALAEETPPAKPESAGLEEEPVQVGISIGGTKVSAGVLTTQGILGTAEDQPSAVTWQEIKAKYPEIGDPVQRAAMAIADQVELALKHLRVPPERLKGLGISWAGTGDPQKGLLRNDKIEGFIGKEVDLLTPLSKELQSRFGREIPVEFLHDTEAAALGEYRDPQGAMYGVPNGIVVTVGTGVAVSVLKDGKPIYSVPGKIPAHLAELGWHTMRQRDGTFVYRGLEAKGGSPYAISPSTEKGEMRLEQWLGGPWLAARFVQRIRKEGFTDQEVFGEVVEFAEDAYPSEVHRPIVADAELQSRILQTVTRVAKGRGVLAVAAQRFIEETGKGLGQALKAYRQAYQNENVKEVRPSFTGRIVLVSTVGEKFGLGVTNAEGEDLFLASIRHAAGTQDVLRSPLIGPQREFAFAVPVQTTSGLEELREGVDYEVEDDGGLRFLRTVRIKEGFDFKNHFSNVHVGKGTRILKDALLRGEVSIGQDGEIGGKITQYTKIGSHVRIHGESNIGFAEIGDWVHLQDTTLRGYGREAHEMVVVEGGNPVDTAKMKPEEAALYKAKDGVVFNTVIRQSTLKTTPGKVAWSFVDENKSPVLGAETLAAYGVQSQRTEVESGSIIEAARVIDNSRIKALVQIKDPLLIEHSVIDEKATIRAGANITRSYIGRKVRVGSEVSKSWLGEGFVSEHQSSYVSVVAPNEFLIANDKGELEIVPSLNTTNIGAGTVFANYGGLPDAGGKKSLKGTAFIWAGFTGSVSKVINKYDHPDVPLTNLPKEREVTILYPFTLTKGEVWGTVLPFTFAGGLSPKSHKIGWVLDKYSGLLKTHLKNGLDPRVIEGSIRLGLYLIQEERKLPADKRRWTDAQMDEGERIYNQALQSGKWSPQTLQASAQQKTGLEEEPTTEPKPKQGKITLGGVEVGLGERPELGGIQVGQTPGGGTVTVVPPLGNKLIILGPDAVPILESFQFLKPRDGKPIPLVVVARDDQQAQTVRDRAAQLEIPILEVVNLEKVESTLEQAIKDIFSRYILRDDEVWDLRVYYTVDQLLEAARFLGVPEPEAFVQAAEGLLQEAVGRYM